MTNLKDSSSDSPYFQAMKLILGRSSRGWLRIHTAPDRVEFAQEIADLVTQERNRVLDEIAERLPEKYDGGVTFKKPDEKQILEDGKTIGRNQIIAEVKKILEEVRHG